MGHEQGKGVDLLNDFDWAISPDGHRWVSGDCVLPVICGGAEDAGDAGDGTGTTDPGATSGGTGDGGAGNSGQGGDEKKFSQEEVNSLVTRETSKAVRGKLDPKELGFDSAKEMKDWVDAQKKAADDAKDQTQKDLDEAREAARNEAKTEILSKANERLVQAEFKLAAANHDVVDANDAMLIAKSLDIWNAVELNDETGVVSGFDDDFFKQLKEQKAHLFKVEGQGGTGDIGAGAGNGSPGGATGKLTPEALKKQYPALGR